jgi:uncharacterized membrane protein YcaP (DUF421 family)
MDWSWITTTWTPAAMTVVSAAGIYAAVIVYTRLVGLRSFSKMSSFDFAMTVAVGSIVATTVLTRDPPLLQAMVALGAIYALQQAVAWLRQRFPSVRSVVDNRPVLLMENGRMLPAAMREADVTRGDVLAKLRAANVFSLEQVRAVVLETTGDISVLHASGPEVGDLDEAVLGEVRRV